MESIVHKINKLDEFTEIPVNDRDIEDTVLTCLLHSEKARNKISDINEDDFYSFENREIFRDFKEFIINTKKFDLHTLPYELKQKTSLIIGKDKGVNAAQFNLYLGKLKDISSRRTIQYIARDLYIFAKIKNVDYIKGFASKKIEDIKAYGGEEILEQNKNIEERFLRLLDEGRFGSLSTGFKNLDSHIGGLYPGCFYVIGGMPAVGKTTFMLNIVLNVLQSSKKVMFCSLEMPQEYIQLKLISEITGISTEKLMKVEDTEIAKKAVLASEQISKYIFYRTGNKGVSVESLEEELLKIGGVDIIFIDYLQKILPSNSRNPRYEQVSRISSDLKLLAMKYGIPVVTIASINRNIANREDKRPALSDLRDSGNIEYDLDVALLLYRKSQFEYDTENEAKIIIAKDRYGVSNIEIDMIWKPKKSRFIEKYIE